MPCATLPLWFDALLKWETVLGDIRPLMSVISCDFCSAKMASEAVSAAPLVDFSEKFQLKGCGGWRFCLLANNVDSAFKLFVCHLEYRNRPLFWNHVSHALDVDIGRAIACTVSDINGKLVHAEAVFQEILPKQSGALSLFFCLDR